MPATSSASSIKRWPSPDVVRDAANAWARAAAEERPDLIALGYFGSYARGEAGFGSDLDLIAVVASDNRPPMERGYGWHTETLPVPTDLIVYTVREWKRLKAEDGRFGQTLRAETRWLVKREALSRHSEAEQVPPIARPSVAKDSCGQGQR